MRNFNGRKTGMPIQIKIIIAVILIVIIAFATSVANDLQVSTVSNVKVIELQQQQLIKGDKESMRTEIRYLIITDKGTFVSETSWVNGKFNNSDIFWHLQKDSTYNLKVAGFGKGFFFDYKNVLKVTKVQRL